MGSSSVPIHPNFLRPFLVPCQAFSGQLFISPLGWALLLIIFTAPCASSLYFNCNYFHGHWLNVFASNRLKAKHQRIDAFELWCWRRLLRVLWTARRSNQSILKEISPEYSLEGLMLKLQLQSLAIWCEEMTHWKRPWCWERSETKG